MTRSRCGSSAIIQKNYCLERKHVKRHTRRRCPASLGGITPRFCSATENKTTEVPLRGGFVLVVFPNLCVNRLMTERYLVITQLTEKLAAAENLEGKG